MADDGEDENDSVTADKTREEESIPLAVGLEVGNTCGVLSCVPLEDVGEVDFIHSVKTSCSERQHSSEDDAEQLSSVLLVAEA